MKKIICITKEIEAFENACGVSAETFIPNRKSHNVDLRDIFIWLNSKNIDDVDKTMSMLNRSRTSYYAAVDRFNNRYKMYEDYRKKANEIQTKLSGQLSIF